jgi:hypothetical protein
MAKRPALFSSTATIDPASADRVVGIVTTGSVNAGHAANGAVEAAGPTTASGSAQSGIAITRCLFVHCGDRRLGNDRGACHLCSCQPNPQCLCRWCMSGTWG